MGLRVVADLDVVAEHGAPFERLQLAHKCAQQRRLARAVRAEQAYAVAAPDLAVRDVDTETRALLMAVIVAAAAPAS